MMIDGLMENFSTQEWAQEAAKLLKIIKTLHSMSTKTDDAT